MHNYFCTANGWDGKPAAIDQVINGLGTWGGKTVAEMLEEHPDGKIMPGDDFQEWQDSAFVEPPHEITEERFDDMLEVLPPMKWYRGDYSESFMLSELVCGNIAMIFCRIGKKYFELADRITLTPAEIVKKCQEVK